MVRHRMTQPNTRFRRTAQLLATLLFTTLFASCEKPAPVANEVVNTPADLSRLSEAFAEARVDSVAPGVWIARNYGLANSILIEGDDGLIVIDTMESMQAGRAVAKAFRPLSDKPLKAIIYTHNHADHVFGAQAFVEELGDGSTPIEVLAQDDTAPLVHRIVSEYRPIISRRSFRMFGSGLDDEGFQNNGLGRRLGIDKDSEFGFVTPTKTVGEVLSTTISGVNIQLIHAPGETDDQIFVWLPQKRLLAPGDNIYSAFPNLYTIRGTPYRSPKKWAASIDKMRSLPIEILLPSHTAPLLGKAKIHATLTDYRDAIRYVYDQSVRWINAGATPDELVEKVQLPQHLAESPYLKEFYGRVNWSARAIFAGNLGWFSGNPSDLNPVAPSSQAELMAELAGGVDALGNALQQAMDKENYQWALQLSDHLLQLSPNDNNILKQRAQALRTLGEASSNPNQRHYYLSSAAEIIDGPPEPNPPNASDEMLRNIPLSIIFDALATNLQAEKALNTNTRTGFEFTDTGETHTLIVRRGVVEHHKGLPVNGRLDISVKVDSLNWRKLLAKQRSPVKSLASDFEFETGGRLALAKLLKLFSAEDAK